MIKRNIIKIALFLAAYCVLAVGAYSYQQGQPQTATGGGSGTINQLDQWKSDGTNITQAVANKPIKITGVATGTCLTLNGSSILSTITCGAGGGASTTTINGVSGPDFTFATGTATGIGLTISTSTGTVTFTPTVSSGFSIPRTASTTEWAAAYATSTALTPAYIRSLFSNSATGLTYSTSTGETTLTSGYNIPLSASTTNWNGFYDVPSTRITAGTGIDWSGNTLNVGGLTTSEFTSANVSQWTNDAGYLTSVTIATSTVRGMLSATSPITYNSSTGDIGFSFATNNNWTGTNDFATTTATKLTVDNLTLVVDNINDRVGIGTSTPGTKLVVSTGNTGPELILDGGANARGSAVHFYQTSLLRGALGVSGEVEADSSSDMAFWANTGSGLRFYSNGSTAERMVVTSAGNVGIGTSSPASILDVWGNLTVGTSSVPLILANSATGRVGIGSSTPNARLVVTGASGSTADTFVVASSTFSNLLRVTSDGRVVVTNVLEIPNGTAPVADDPGEIAHDTSDNQLILDDRIIRTGDDIYKFSVPSTSPSFASGTVKYLPRLDDGFTVLSILCDVQESATGTSKILYAYGETLTCDKDGAVDDGSIASPTVPASTFSSFSTGAASGTVHYLNVTIKGTYTRE